MKISNLSIETLCKELIDEINSLKYQITLKVFLSKYKKTENFFLYFNFVTKTVINSKYTLDKSSPETFNRIENCISEESGWIIESIDSEYVNISIYNPLSESTYIQLPLKLRNSMKDLINIKNNGNECFLWCNIRYFNPIKTHSERIRKADKNAINDLDYEDIDFPVFKKDYCKIEQQSIIYINVFCYENDLTCLVYV